MIIGLIGNLGSGKDYITDNFIVPYFGYKRTHIISVADSLKVNLIVDYHIKFDYLYKKKTSYNNFIRGWHGLLANAFYLPDVFLENTFENGKWIVSEDEVYAKYLKGEFIKGDDMWPEFPLNVKFNKTETLNKLKRKSGSKSQPKIELYNCEVLHFNL